MISVNLAETDVVVPMLSVEVTSVSRQESTVGRSPAAIYVVTGDMIRRSGVRSIPEALRLAPGVQVARLDANKWSVSIRGHNGRFANKLLVQIDGRTVYTPLFAGTFWDVQDVLLEDVARIEIIRGPGATVWGANAVNGVINVITKSAADTQGFFAEGGSGGERDFFSGRVGGAIGDDGGWRAYGKWFDRDQGYSPIGQDSDDWQVGRLGFRADWKPGWCDTLTFQGDYYDGDAGQHQALPTPMAPFVLQNADNQQLKGGNALMRWSRKIDDDSDWSLQMYYDRTERTFDSVGFREDRDTVDFDFQHRFALANRHSIIWGLGYRNTSDSLQNSFHLRFNPRHRSDNRFGVFAQDEITLRDDELFFTVGSKLSRNDYTGFEIQPTARLLFTPSNRSSLWASVSRAVRVPSRASGDIRLATPPGVIPGVIPVVSGNRSIDPEELVAWEIGMRGAPTDEFSWDVAAFYNQYDDLHGIDPGTPGFNPDFGLVTLPVSLENSEVADSYGVELATTWQIQDDWTLRGAYSFLRIVDSSNRDGESPRNQLFAHSSWNLHRDVEFDLIGRYADNLAALSVPAFFEMDMRLAWRPTDNVELALVGRNLLDSAHPEFGDDTYAGVLATEVQREIFGVFTVRY